MPEDSTRMESPGIAKADRLYRGFPDFSAWGELSAEDADLWSRFAASLEVRRRTASPESLKAAVEVAVRAAALDTGAIEGLYNVDRGFTMTVAVQGLAWQQMVEERGAGVRELFEAQLAAYELVLDAVTHKLPITEAWIRALHETLCGPQKTYRVLTDQGWQEQELPKGQYKTRPNHVHLTDGTVHPYSPVDQVPSEMHRLIEQIRTPEFEAAHPVLQASYCHYAFVSIHPFADGNGRVARALASTFFYRAQSIPLVIFENQRPAYLEALALADRGDHAEVIGFFRDRGIDTMLLIQESLTTAMLPKPEQQASRISRAAKVYRDLSDEDLTITSSRIAGKMTEIFKARAAGMRNPAFSASTAFWSVGAPHSLIYIPDSFYKCVNVATLDLFSLTRKDVYVSLRIDVYWSTSPRPFPFLILTSEVGDELEARLEDVVPELTPQFLLRLDQWVERQLGRMLTDLARKVEA
jgi:Fic family protein